MLCNKGCKTWLDSSLIKSHIFFFQEEFWHTYSGMIIQDVLTAVEHSHCCSSLRELDWHWVFYRPQPVCLQPLSEWWDLWWPVPGLCLPLSCRIRGQELWKRSAVAQFTKIKMLLLIQMQGIEINNSSHCNSGFGLDDPRWSLPTQGILWFCDSASF